MFARFRTACLPVAFLLLTGNPTLAPAEPPTEAGNGCPRQKDRQAQVKLVSRTYQVADLIIPIEDFDLDMPGSHAVTDADGTGHVTPAPRTSGWVLSQAPVPGMPKRTLEGRLIKLITTAVAPRSWSVHGGQGTIEYCPSGMSLVITQTPRVQERIAELLAALHREQDLQVAVEVRFVSVPESCPEKIGVDFNDIISKTAPGEDNSCAAPGPVPCSSPGNTAELKRIAFLDNDQVGKLLDTLQGDPQANVMQAPKLTLFNGQRGAFKAADEQFFVTSVRLTAHDGQQAFIPEVQSFDNGVQLSLLPSVSEDRRHVQLNFKARLTNLESANVPLFPITGYITPLGKDGQRLAPVSFTQFIQQPKFNTLCADTTLDIPDGRTALLGGWKRVSERRTEFGPPVLSQIPYINRLFKSVGYGKELENLYVLVTPRIIVNKEEVPQTSGPFPAPKQSVAQAKDDVEHDIEMKLRTPVTRLIFQNAPLQQVIDDLRDWQHMNIEPDYAALKAEGISLSQPVTINLEQVSLKSALNSLLRQVNLTYVIKDEVPWITPEATARSKCVQRTYELEEEEPPCREPKAEVTQGREKKLTRLLEKYERACSEGHLDEAAKLARKAVAIDPACFSRKPACSDTKKESDANQRAQEVLNPCQDFCPHGSIQDFGLHGRIWFTDPPSQIPPIRTDGGVQ